MLCAHVGWLREFPAVLSVVVVAGSTTSVHPGNWEGRGLVVLHSSNLPLFYILSSTVFFKLRDLYSRAESICKALNRAF